MMPIQLKLDLCANVFCVILYTFSSSSNCAL